MGSLSRAAWATLALLIPLAAFVLWVDRAMTPFADEWAFLCSAQPLSLLFAPHNEHLDPLAVAAYLGTAKLFGIGSYWPLLVPLLVAHAFVVAAVLHLTGSRVAAATATFLGAGWLNLFWAFQVGYVAAAALGLWALVAQRAGRPRLAAVLLVLGILTQGDTLFFVAACVGLLIWDRRWRELGWPFLPVAVWIAWAIVARPSSPEAGPTLLGALGFTVEGLIATIGLTAGPTLAAGITALVLASRPRLDALATAAGAGLLAEFVGLAVIRQGVNPASSPQYLYVSVLFLVVGLVDLARTSRRPVTARAALAIALVVNVGLLLVNANWPANLESVRAAGLYGRPASCPGLGEPTAS